MPAPIEALKESITRKPEYASYVAEANAFSDEVRNLGTEISPAEFDALIPLYQRLLTESDLLIQASKQEMLSIDRFREIVLEPIEDAFTLLEGKSIIITEIVQVTENGITRDEVRVKQRTAVNEHNLVQYFDLRTRFLYNRSKNLPSAQDEAQAVLLLRALSITGGSLSSLLIQPAQSPFAADMAALRAAYPDVLGRPPTGINLTDDEADDLAKIAGGKIDWFASDSLTVLIRQVSNYAGAGEAYHPGQPLTNEEVEGLKILSNQLGIVTRNATSAYGVRKGLKAFNTSPNNGDIPKLINIKEEVDKIIFAHGLESEKKAWLFLLEEVTTVEGKNYKQLIAEAANNPSKEALQKLTALYVKLERFSNVIGNLKYTDSATGTISNLEKTTVLREHLFYLDEVIHGLINTVAAKEGKVELFDDSERRADWTLEAYFDIISRSLHRSYNIPSSEGQKYIQEFKIKIEQLPHEDDKKYWYAKLAIYDMLISAESPTGNDYSIDLSKIRGGPTFKFERLYMLEGILYNYQFSEYSLGIIDVITEFLSDREGPFAAKKLNAALMIGRGDHSFYHAVSEATERNLNVRIVATDAEYKKAKELDPTARVIPRHLLDTVFAFCQATDLRGTIFVEDTAEAVTKSFGGQDYTKVTQPGATISYDANRYNKELSSMGGLAFLLGFVDLPDVWMERMSAGNPENVVKDEATGVRDDDATDANIANEFHTRRNKVDSHRHHIRDLYLFSVISQGDLDNAIAMAIEHEEFKADEDNGYKDAFEKQTNAHGERFVFAPQNGTLFPSWHEAMTAYPAEKLPDGSLNRDPTKRVFDTAMYFVAFDGWTEVTNMVGDAPKAMDAVHAAAYLDKLHGAIGKAKIVPGSHHTAMNLFALSIYIKTFKYLEPRTGLEYKKLKLKMEEKIANAAGLPPYVKKYLLWLVGTNMLRPKDPSRSVRVEQAQHEIDEGLEEGEFSIEAILRKWAIYWAEMFNGAAKKNIPILNPVEKVTELPELHIQWSQQDSVKGEAKH